MKTVAMATAMVFLFVCGFAVAQTEDEVEDLKRNCDSGVLGDFVKLGKWNDEFLTHGRRDEARATQLYQKACNGGELVGCRALGHKYLNGTGGVPKDTTRAVELFQQACDGGVAGGCYAGGRMYREHRDADLTVKFFEKGCELGLMESCSEGAKFCDPVKGKRSDPTQAVSFSLKACDLGDGDSCFRIALYFDTGMFVTKDTGRANELFKKACLHGHEVACEKFTR